MLTLIRGSLVFISTMTPVLVMGQDLQTVSPNYFEDVDRGEALISAPHWLRGAFFEAEPSGKSPRLLAFLPQPNSYGVLCVEATTINGRYEATAEYDVESSKGGSVVELAYNTGFPEVWANSSAQNSGVVISTGACDEMASETETVILPSVLNGVENIKRTAAGETVLILNLHARGAQEVTGNLAYRDASVEVECGRLDPDTAIEFNFTCKAMLPPDASGRAEFNFKKISRGREVDGPTAFIDIPEFP